MRIKILFLLSLSIFSIQSYASAVITIKNGNESGLNLSSAFIGFVVDTSPGLGFSDQTPFTPVGGNFATTLGQARLNAMQYAVNKLSNRLNSNVNINIIVVFNPFADKVNRVTLAAAGATDFVTLTNGPTPNTLHPIALGEKILGKNANGVATDFQSYDLVVIVNSNIDVKTLLSPTRFYYGFDQKPPSRNIALQNGGTAKRKDIDFISTVTHELIHGLGFSTLMDDTGIIRNGAGVDSGLDDVFMRNLEFHGQLTPSFVDLTPSSRSLANVSITNLHWTGPAVLSEIAKQASSNPGYRNGHAAMYGPSPYEKGSSVSHFSNLFNTTGATVNDPFDEMMEPFSEGANHNIGLAAQVLEDVGWGKLNSNPATTDLSIKVVNPNLNPAIGSNEVYSISVTNNSAQLATGVVVTNFLPNGSTFVSVNPANGATCDETNVSFNRIVSCSLPSLPASGTAVFTVTATINNADSSFSANVESLNSDSFFSNNNAVNNVDPNLEYPPVFAVIEDRSKEAGETVNISISATDFNPFVPTISITNKPANAVFKDNSDGTATFTWPVTDADIGEYNISFTATDGNSNSSLMDTTSVKITVTAKAPPASSSDSGGCSLNQSAKFDPLFPGLLLLLSIVYLTRKKQKLKM